jgi:hypothetical protein
MDKEPPAPATYHQPRKQEQVLLDNFVDLSQKYADLHGRLNQLTQ